MKKLGIIFSLIAICTFANAQQNATPSTQKTSATYVMKDGKKVQVVNNSTPQSITNSPNATPSKTGGGNAEVKACCKKDGAGCTDKKANGTTEVKACCQKGGCSHDGSTNGCNHGSGEKKTE